MDNGLIVGVIAAALVIALIVWLLVRRPGDTRHIEDMAPGADVGGAAATAVEDTIGQILGVDAVPPFTPPPAIGEPDRLTTIKGLGPKAAARLNELGIHRYDQLAALDETGATGLDAQMGTFQGRLVRDRWIEQAGYLSRGDTAAFEAQFGKLG